MLRIVCLPLVLATIPAQAQPTPINGDFEATGAEQLGKARQHTFYAHPGWQATAGTWAAQTGTYYKVTPPQGERFLRPRSRDGKRCELVQKVAIAAFGAPRPRALLTHLLMRTGIGRDRTEVRFEVLDGGGAVLRSVGSEPRADTVWTPFDALVRIPKTAEAIRIRLIGHHHAGRITDAFFDDVRMQGIGPGYPKKLAGRSSKDLIAEFNGAREPATRRQLLLALAGSDQRGAKFLSNLLATERDSTRRLELLRLLLISGHKAAVKPIRAALRGDDLERRTVLRDLDLAPFDWAGEVAVMVYRQAAHRLEYLVALARLGAFQKLNNLYAVTRDKELKVMILDALRQGSFSAETLRPILASCLEVSSLPDRRYAGMRLLAGTGSPRYLKVLEPMSKAETSLSRRGNYLRLAADYNSMAAIEAMLPLVARKLERCPSAFLQWAPAMTDKAVGDWMRKTAASDHDPLLRQTAIAHMLLQPRSLDIGLLSKLVEDPEDQVALAAIAGLRGEAGAVARLRKSVQGKSGPRAAAAILALAGSPTLDPSVEALAAQVAAESRHWQARVAALSILGSRATQHREVLAENLTHPIRQVRAAAMRALGQARDKQTIETLLARLDAERSTTLAFLVETLVALTGVDKGSDPALWRSWWSTVKSGFVVPLTAPKRAAGGASGSTVATFFDLPVQTDNIVFVIDVSGSMKTEVRGDTKLATVKDEVIKVLVAMSKSSKGRGMFNIVTFGNTPRTYHKTLQRATKDNVRKAFRWIMRLEPRGWTNIHDSLTTAMEMPGVESIFLLSDGAPSTGRYVGMNQVRESITTRNRSLLIRINTVAVGGNERSRRFMKKLAEENFGKNRDHN